MWREDWEGERGRGLTRKGAVGDDCRRTRPVEDKSENKDRCEGNFSKAGKRLGTGCSYPRTNAESQV